MERRLAAIIAADVVGYSKLMGENSSRTLGALRELRNEILQPVVAKHRGEIVKSMGDGWLVEFASVVDAVGCAVNVQEGLSHHDLIKLRIGVHVGDIVHEEEDIFGDGVNIASRLQEAVAAGGVLISDDVRRQLDAERRKDFVSVGELYLKNIAEPIGGSVWPASAASETKRTRVPPAKRKPALTIGSFMGRGDDEFVAQGITEDLTAVLSRQSGFDYVLDEAMADYAVNGTVRIIGDRCRVSANLIDLTMKKQIWAGKYEVDPTDHFEVQDKCVYWISSGIRTFLWSEVGRKVAARPINELSTDDLLALGSHYFAKQTVASFFDVVGVMDRILKVEPENFMALAMSAMGASMAEFTYGYAAPPKDLADQARRNAEKAIRINSSSDFVCYVQAYVDLYLNHDYDGAVLAANRSVENNPNFAFGHNIRVLALSLGGRYQEGLDASDQSLSSDPNNPFFHQFLRAKAYALFGLQKYDEAADSFMQADKIMPSLPQNLLGIVASSWQVAETQIAKNAIGRLVALAPDLRASDISLPPYKDTNLLGLIQNSVVAAGLPDLRR